MVRTIFRSVLYVCQVRDDGVVGKSLTPPLPLIIWNHPKVPAFCGRRGSIRELVASANALGVFWGGHFSTQDGMHFEISRLE
jgi:hypothetical protein